jgi:trans-2,3-dihydro-3-hydroxyanthranilate isomerase
MSNQTTLSYYVLDVFSQKKYEGNQLAVVLTKGDLPLTDYQNIAREFGYAETSFLQYQDGIPQVRSFTPAGIEVHGAGHNLLGAACLVALKDPAIFFQQKDGPFIIMKDQRFTLSIQEQDGLPVIGMQQSPAVVKGVIPVEVMAAALNLQPEDLHLDGWVPSRVQTEVLHAMIPIKDVDTLHRIVPNKPQLSRLSSEHGFEGWYCFTLPAGSGHHIAETRFFNPFIGIDEDAATGSAAGPLAGFLHQQGMIEKDRPYTFLQGVVMQHPSVIQVEVTDNGIWVSGSSVIVMEGRLYV